MRTKEIWEREICHTGEQRRCQMPDAWYNSIIFPQAEWILLNNPLDFISSRGAHHVLLSKIIQKYSFQHEGTIASCKAHARTFSSRNYTRKPIYIIKNKETMALHRGVGVGGRYYEIKPNYLVKRLSSTPLWLAEMEWGGDWNRVCSVLVVTTKQLTAFRYFR